ncbi:MAG TPA: hypothetical protein DCM87_13955, partial [Planctomycetes bacterium]|nr:hypothetical protein [Planctomycetota bacterium]
IRRAGDADAVEFVRPGQALGEIVLRTRSGTGPWRESSTAASGDVRRDGGGDSTGAGGLRLAYEGPSANERGLPECALDETFEMRGDALVWSVRLRNTGGAAIEIGDLALVLPMHTDYVWDHEETFVRRVFRHACIAGHGSFLYWLPVKGSGSFLVMQPEGGASLEYFTAGGMDYAYGRERFCAFIHSKGAAETDPRGTWRQAHTSRVLAPGEEAAYAFAFRWADSYAGVRELCARNGVDVRVAPGMVVPRDLGARIALRSAHAIEGIECEFPAETHVEPLPAPAQDTRIYKLRFERLGENLVTVRWGGGRAMPLEFFVTLPIETLLKKRAAFIASRQQHRDPSKWYDGLFSLWDRRQPAGRNLLGPDHTGGLHPYMVSGSDDPSNSKCIFLSEKNAAYPDPKEIEALEYFVDRFVWGKHQRTDEEEPHPFGIYGCDSWRQCRLSATGLGSGGRGQERMWRTFDYTTYFALYFNLYRIASQRPDLARAHDAREYLARAYGTARAYFEVPYAIEMKGWALNGWCDWAYKVGNFHEKCLLPLIEALEREGEPEKAARLRGEWEKKVKYMIYDTPWPFASEMPIDSTAYESTYAAGAYALTRGLAPGANLWYDKNLKKWYSHPAIDPAAHARFLARQHAANLACRGVLAPSYWAFGSDFRGCGGGSYTLSYMSQMGGWAVLDHALRFDANPAGDLRLGYASMLSSWALVNAGDAASSFGFWTPGQEHDGAASWGFEPKRFGPVWATAGGMGELPRGAWPVDGEIDHGLAAGVEAACTVVFEDPVFGLLAYGGEAAWEDGRIAVIPRDGVRRRLSVLRGERRLHLCLDRDGFAAERPLVLGPALDGVAFTLEPRAPHAHETVLTIEGLPAGDYTVACGAAVRTFAARAGGPSRVFLAVEAGAAPKATIAPVVGCRL